MSSSEHTTSVDHITLDQQDLDLVEGCVLFDASLFGAVWSGSIFNFPAIRFATDPVDCYLTRILRYMSQPDSPHIISG